MKSMKEKIIEEWSKDEPNMTKIRQLEYQLRIEEGSKEIASAVGLCQDLDELQEVQEIDLEMELKKTRQQSSLIGLLEISKIMKRVFDSSELEYLRKNL